jgi:hypothetical protein
MEEPKHPPASLLAAWSARKRKSARLALERAEKFNAEADELDRAAEARRRALEGVS